MIHDLKAWPVFFEPVLVGVKSFEIRFNDRGYKVGDILYLREWNPETELYSGRECQRRVKYILEGHPGLQPGFVIMGLTSL